MKALVVGTGSIGQRHLRNLRALGVERLLAVDPAEERRNRIVQELGAEAFDTLDDALARRPQVVLICTPPHLHTPAAQQALTVGAHVFIEKPIAASLDGLDELLAEARRRSRHVCVGYNLRFNPGLRQLKAMLDEGRIGRILAIRAEFGQYLPDWRPTQDYRTGYITKVQSGGGIILDASHELDYVRWLGGEVERVWCAAGHLSSLEMATEDVAAITLWLSGGVVAEVHLDCVQRAYSRSCKLIGEEGTLVWDFQEGVHWYDGTRRAWHHDPVTVDPNEMYLDELRHFLRCVHGEDSPSVDGDTGRRVLEIALAARRSAERGEVVRC